jgi:gamma-glutamylcyclotransferase (GGCT)/AIG2-like uncharacterized protein YtfP
MTAAPISRLATYGTLRPGQSNHDQLAGLDGDWTTGTVRGVRYDSGWGEAEGYPGLVLDPNGPEVPVDLFRSPDLTAHWPRLDAFEGEGYDRTTTVVETADGPVEAWIYVLAPRPLG